MREPKRKDQPEPEPESGGPITDRSVLRRLINVHRQPAHALKFWQEHAPHLATPRTVGSEEEWLRRYYREHERCTWLLDSGLLAGDALNACERLYEREKRLQSLEEEQ